MERITSNLQREITTTGFLILLQMGKILFLFPTTKEMLNQSNIRFINTFISRQCLWMAAKNQKSLPIFTADKAPSTRRAGRQMAQKLHSFQTETKKKTEV